MSEENAIAMIVAMANKRVIGNDGGLPWHISEDLKHFRKTTTGHAIIMGRKTYESIGKPLPKRRNIVVTRQQGAAFEGCEVAHSLTEAIELARQTDDLPFIIGGASLFKEALPDTTMLFLTDIDSGRRGRHVLPRIRRIEVQRSRTTRRRDQGRRIPYFKASRYRRWFDLQ